MINILRYKNINVFDYSVLSLISLKKLQNIMTELKSRSWDICTHTFTTA